MPSHYHNEAPKGTPAAAPVAQVKAEFARRLQRLLVDRAWNQSELARRAALHMDDGKFGRDNVSGYVRGLSLPGPIRLNALCKAFGVPADALLPGGTMPSVDRKAPPPLDISDAGEGTAWLCVNQAVSWDKALKIMQILKGE